MLASLGFDISIDTTVLNTPGDEHDDIADLILRSLSIITPKICCLAQGDKNEDYSNSYSVNEDISIEHFPNKCMLIEGKSTSKKLNSKSTNFETEKSSSIDPESESLLSEVEIWDNENPEPSEDNKGEWNDWLVRRICRNKP